MLKKNGGITLIALVITIIVLLILAGVSIAMLSGDNGILNRASQSSVQNQLGSFNDAVSLFVSDKITEYYEKAYVEQSAATVAMTMDKYLTTVVTDATLTNATTGVPGLTTTASEESTEKAFVAVTAGDKSLTNIVLKMKDSKMEYTSTGTYSNGKINWVITKAAL